MSAPTFVAAGASNSGTGAVAPTVPSLPASTEVVLICLVQSSNQAISAPTNAGGTNWTSVTWTEIGAQADVSGGAAASVGAYRLGMYWCRINTTTVTPGTVSVADTINHTIARILAFTGCIDTGNPFNLLGFVGGATASFSLTWNFATNNTVSTTVNDALVLVVGCGSHDTTSTTLFGTVDADLLTSPTERADDWTASGTGGGFVALTGTKATAGQIADGGSSALNDFYFDNTAGSVSGNYGMRVIELIPPAPSTVLPVLPNFSNQPSNFTLF